ncbi:hypothetical protein F5B21DRAFT_487840 [Xylaria acuta]|nr:hypothetical protein F5B21DRAFT_487840 [Xylaria acuta]
MLVFEVDMGYVLVGIVCLAVFSPAARTEPHAMDQVLKDHNIYIDYATMLALNLDALKSTDAVAHHGTKAGSRVILPLLEILSGQ